MRDAPRLIRKLAHDKYGLEFNRCMAVFKDLSAACGDGRLAEKLDGLDRLMELRSGKKGDAT
jgi:hypothetical protein